MLDTDKNRLLIARELLEKGEPDQAWAICESILTENPDEAEALWVASGVMLKANKLVVSYHFIKRVTELKPEKFAGWLQLGHVCDRLWRFEQSERALLRAVKLAGNAREKAVALANIGSLYIANGQFSRAKKLLEESVELDPNSRMAKGNLGFCQLAERDWANGWKNYRFSLGSSMRKRMQYKDEPEWNGVPGVKVVIYGEQGLGDELSFSSLLPEAIENTEKLIVDCDARLLGLFRRSFPKAKFYGSRKDMTLKWDKEDQDFDASLSMGSLGEFYRKTPESFTGKPWLVPCPDRKFMWEGLWGQKAKPIIGIAWTGGLHHTGMKFRQWTLKDMLPILEAVEAHFVCLQYKDSQKEIDEFRKEYPHVDLVQYPFGTLTNDYDDTAALVASLDRVVCMQTAVAHLSGALGVPCDVFVPRNSQWRYGETQTDVPWYQSVKVIRQAVRGHWKNTIEEYADGLAKFYRTDDDIAA